MTPHFNTVSVDLSKTRSVKCAAHYAAVMGVSSLKSNFASRLIELCEERQLPERGRQTALAKQFGVSQGATRKWFIGTGLPELETVIALAEYFDVNVNWLLQGVGPKRGDKIETKALVMNEVLERFPAEERQEVLNYIAYKVERSANTLFTGEQKARYMKMIEAFKKQGGRRGGE